MPAGGPASAPGHLQVVSFDRRYRIVTVRRLGLGRSNVSPNLELTLMKKRVNGIGQVPQLAGVCVLACMRPTSNATCGATATKLRHDVRTE